MCEAYASCTIVVMIYTTEVICEAIASYTIKVMSYTIGYVGSDRDRESRNAR